MNLTTLTKLTILLFTVFLLSFPVYAKNVLESSAAGDFYPADPEELSCMIDGFLENASSSKDDAKDKKIFALLVPHAGYRYSGQTAAYGYRLLKNQGIKTVVVIGPSHRFAFKGISVYPEGAFRTPFGEVGIDDEFAGKLLRAGGDVFFEPRAFESEHSVEVQVPFLQKVVPGVKLVPVIMGDCDFPACERFARALIEAAEGRRDVLFIVSTDMYHGYDYEEAEIIDSITLSYLEGMDAHGLYAGLQEGTMQLCGGGPAVSVLIAAKESGHNVFKKLDYTTSARALNKMVKGEWTVGYTSCVISRKEGEKQMFTDSQKIHLLEIARRSIETYLKTGNRMEASEQDSSLSEKLGVFVTLREKGQLRGCIGNLSADQPLYLSIRDMAVEAATGDPRFPPVHLSELGNIEIEISVLSHLKKVDSADEITAGIHGVLVRKGYRSGVYLPQVAEETGWSKEEFLSSLCAHKAGLSADAWKDKNTELFIFTAEVFSEPELKKEQ